MVKFQGTDGLVQRGGSGLLCFHKIEKLVLDVALADFRLAFTYVVEKIPVEIKIGFYGFVTVFSCNKFFSQVVQVIKLLPLFDKFGMPCNCRWGERINYTA